MQLSELYYAGSHGMDIMGPAKSSSGFKVNGTRSKDKKVSFVVQRFIMLARVHRIGKILRIFLHELKTSQYKCS